MNRYSPTEFIKNMYSLLLTKLIFRQARFIRRPIYIRGKKSILGGKGLTTGRYCRFDLNGIEPTLFIGDNCEFGDFTHIVALKKVEIGNNVLIASKVFISDTSHGKYKEQDVDLPSVAPNLRKKISQPVKIGENVWIGENAVILSGVTIGNGCVVGANSVVTKDIPNNSIAVGSPAKVIKVFKNNEWRRV